MNFGRHCKSAGAVLAASMMLLSMPACKARQASKTKDTSGLGDLEIVANTDFQSLCEFFFAPSNPEECRTNPIIIGLCAQKQKTLDDSIKSFLLAKKPGDIGLSPAVEAKVHDDFKKDAMASVTGSAETDQHKLFNEAADRCMNHTAHSDADHFEKLAATPEFQAEGRTSQVEVVSVLIYQGMVGVGWRLAPKQFEALATQWGIKNITSVQALFAKYKLTFSPLSWRTTIGLMLCSAGSTVMGSYFDFASQSQTVQSKDSEACKEFAHDWVTNRNSKLSACFGALADICNAVLMPGNLGVLGITTTSDLLNYGMQLSSVGVSTLCLAGGPWARIGCAATNYYANQLMQVARTGNTKAAQCTGADKLGICYLTPLFMDKAWGNDNPIATAENVTDDSGQTWIVRDCCACDKLHFEKAGTSLVYWLLNTEAENYVSVIQRGDFKSGNCGVQENVKIPDGTNPKLFVQYTNCRKVTAIGGACTLSESTNGKLTPRNLPLWDRAHKQPAGKSLYSGLDYVNKFYSGDEFRQ